MADDVAAANAALQAAFEAEMTGWSEADWRRPSFCPGWTLAALVVHLRLVADLGSDSVRRGLRGDAGPPWANGDLAAWRAARAEAQRDWEARPPSALIALFQAGVAELTRAFEAAAGCDPALRAWHPAGAQPIAWWPSQWLFELAIHAWDARVAFEPEAELRPLALPALAPTLPPRLPRWFDPPKVGAARGRVRVRLGQPALPFTVAIAPERPAAIDRIGDGGPADATIDADTAAFALVMTNRRPAAYYVERGRWRVAGDERLARAFAGAFKPV